MNATTLAMRGYAENAVTTRNERRSEYDVFARVTQGLRDTATKAKANFPAYAEALHLNRRLWTALVVDLADPENPIPSDLKARVLYLSEFTQHHTRKILRDGASVMPLLEINMAVMRGLKSEGPSK
ncbi:flagellar biosynthesis regulator FlaF [uncultured Tateyamaria sp.]|uniref:flagellar biosynthesis regulator FlaF n=1 Tax=Tateyamaria sp. 1078 TaxID=3417464 RepID=UPI0026382476|nr:flagellar biosynthesis regulator FlaF [uncultured Tateyamaria sp.]